ncbi:hypothetical protein fnug_113 [Pseudomonas phage fnug]|uniref:Virion structural protein n=2 Tax=Phikzvirus TaxID=680115 RepID=A0A6H2A9D8_9CAUD|nr:internal head protein [Pseudomonas phage SL2]ATN94834.1 hypothetical protein SL2_257 [Pseudomonas phage SL2]QJB22756.1 hypothetical protein fnug_113 [Pseudomonas phage fnug]
MNLNKLLDSLEAYGTIEVKEKVAKAKLKHAAIDDKQISKEPEEAAKLIDELPNDVKATNNGLDVEEAHKPNIHWKSDRGLVTEVDSFGKTYVASEEYPASPHDTRESPDNRPTPVDGKDLDSDDDHLNIFAYDTPPSQNMTYQLNQLLHARTSLECFIDLLNTAGDRGITKQSAAFMHVTLESIDKLIGFEKISIEDFNATPSSAMRFVNISQEEIKERIESIGKKILALIVHVIEQAKVAAQRVLTGIKSVEDKTDELIEKAKSLINKPTVSNERVTPDFDMSIKIDNPKMLFIGDEFVLDDLTNETKVSQFLAKEWPNIARSNIDKVVKLIKDYDLEDNELDKFKEAFEFIGEANQLDKVKDTSLPGNSKLIFQKDKYAPRLGEDKHGDGPDTITIEPRPPVEVRKTLEVNKEAIRRLGDLFKAEKDVLEQLKKVAQGIEDMELRRSKAIWKGARDDANEIISLVNGFITDMSPEYATLISYLLRIAKQRNAVCNMELERYGQ